MQHCLNVAFVSFYRFSHFSGHNAVLSNMVFALFDAIKCQTSSLFHQLFATAFVELSSIQLISHSLTIIIIIIHLYSKYKKQQCKKGAKNIEISMYIKNQSSLLHPYKKNNHSTNVNSLLCTVTVPSRELIIVRQT